MTERERKVTGVAGIFTFLSGEVLVLQESEDSSVTGKKSGDWGYPGERLDQGETPDGTFLRMVKEEVFANAPGGILDRLRGIAKELLGDYEIKPGVWGRAYVINMPWNVDEVINWLGSLNSEVSNHKIVAPGSLFGMQTRPGVSRITEDFLAGKRGIIKPLIDN